MSKSVIGTWTAGGQVRLDIQRLIVTRLLIQANSGGGKSWALRCLLEQTAGKVQQIVIDPEGEFATLREKHDLVIAAAQDGDALAHPKTARLLATRLLETEASAVLDLYDLKAHERHQFVRLFLEAMVDAPKKLWHPVIVGLDEAHVFCPEKGQGESEALGAVLDLATRGRKRGFCLVAATQRLGKFNKSAAAEIKNKLIGSTGLDVDVKRAAFELGMTPKDALATLRALEPGHFFAFGPAIDQVDPRELVVGAVRTTHPKAGYGRAIAPPKPTEAIKALLPKLADLPKEAEHELRTIEDLKRELSNVRRELTQAKRVQPTAPSTPQVDRSALKEAAAIIALLNRALEDAMKFIVQINARDFAAKVGESVDQAALEKAISSAVGQAMKLIESAQASRNRELIDLKRQSTALIERLKKIRQDKSVRISVDVKHNEPFTVAAKAPTTPRPQRPPSAAKPAGDGSVTGPQQNILNALAWLEHKGVYPPTKNTLAAVARVSPTSGGYFNNLGSLRSAGMIEYPTPGAVGFTEAGRAIAQMQDDGGRELHEQWLEIVSAPQAAILKVLIERYPAVMQKDDLAREVGVSETSGGYFNNLGALRTLGAIDYPQKGSVGLTKHVIP